MGRIWDVRHHCEAYPKAIRDQTVGGSPWLSRPELMRHVLRLPPQFDLRGHFNTLPSLRQSSSGPPEVVLLQGGGEH